MKDKKQFERVIAKSECTQRAAEELWKWYDCVEKKGIAPALKSMNACAKCVRLSMPDELP